MKYQNRNWKYQLPEKEQFLTTIRPNTDLSTQWVTLTKEGLLTLSAGFCWDGPSGPTIDTPNSLRASAVHDALFQLMKEGLLDLDVWFDEVNIEFLRFLKEDGMSWFRRRIWYRAVQEYGEEHMNRGVDDEAIYIAPSGQRIQ